MLAHTAPTRAEHAFVCVPCVTQIKPPAHVSDGVEGRCLREPTTWATTARGCARARKRTLRWSRVAEARRVRAQRGRWRPPQTPQKRALAGDEAVAGGDAIRSAASEAAQRSPTATRPATALVLFSGPADRADGLPAQLRALGVSVVEIDVKVGGVDHDLTRPEVAQAILARIRAGEFGVVFSGTPCESFSVAHRPKLRTARWPWGLPQIPEAWARYMRKHNTLARFTIDAARAALDVGAAVAIENPSDRGRVGSPAYWHKYADHGAFWTLPEYQQLGLVERAFSQCAFQATVQKATTIAHSANLNAAFAPLEQRVCTHGFKGHEHVAHGRDEWGRGRANLAAAYPAAMCAFLAQGMASVLGEGSTTAATPIEIVGGRIVDGLALTPSVCGECERQRELMPGFASMRNLLPATEAQLALEALPGSIHSPMQPTKPARLTAVGKVKKGKAHPASVQPSTSCGAGVARPRALIALRQLFLGDIYEQHVQPWLHLAEAAALALLEGRSPPKVPTVVLGQECLQPWARGVVWDCTDPTDCRRVRPSTRDTIFPGRRQVDRAALRAAAKALAWHDADIVNQVGEGGVEVRSDCPLDTVLAWHHAGFEKELESAVSVIEADIKEEWVSAPVAHLPFVPCRLLPRNVVMQERTRVLADGSVEQYAKPRVSQDASDGASASVNQGVPPSERTVTLPTAQAFARALAICDTAGTSPAEEEAGAPPVRAVGYAIDATAAFRFCPLQWAHVWTQCFVYWRRWQDDSGRWHVAIGVCIDRRMGFGGAYAPNRFERVSLLAAAHVQAKQRAFDAAQPPPAHAVRWAQARRRAMEAGELRSHAGAPQAGASLRIEDEEGVKALWAAAQTEPKYLQTFIDDLNGVALDDVVQPPPEVAAVVIDKTVILALGGVPAEPYTRVHVHAQLAVVGLEDLGLEAAANKTMVGNPIVSLGLQVDRARRVVDCPSSKRAAILHEAARATAAARAVPPTVDTAKAGTLTGRLCNLSQVLPEIRPHLEGGYRVSRGMACAAARGRRGGGTQLKLRADSAAHKGWAECLSAATSVVGANVGVALAPNLRFPGRMEGHTITCVTDASGHDGFGGYAFSAAQPETVWVMSEWWPADIKSALLNSGVDRRKRKREESLWALSMPAAELVGAVMVPRAAARAGLPPGPMYAVGDCDAVAMALNAAYSRKPQMRALLEHARRVTEQWLAVSVPREANLDADRLSHPDMAADVCEEARRAGLTVIRVPMQRADWDDVRAAVRAARVAEEQ